jgi:hypothetical protein
LKEKLLSGDDFIDEVSTEIDIRIKEVKSMNQVERTKFLDFFKGFLFKLFISATRVIPALF